MSQLLQVIGETLDWVVGMAWQVDPHAGYLRCTTVWHTDAFGLAAFATHCRAITFPYGVGVPGHIWETETPAWVVDITQDTPFLRVNEAQAAGLRSAFGFPIQVDGQVTGVVEFFSREPRTP
ncbi:GAF domain-containing protein, partial [Scytonema tolypothrichoides VB-61278]